MKIIFFYFIYLKIFLNRQGLANGPLLAICLFTLILFLIAATIVLALIPIYLPTRDVTPSIENIFKKL
jgi:hypothetical protein